MLSPEHQNRRAATPKGDFTVNSVNSVPKAANSRLRTLDLAYCALFTVLMAVCAWVSVPVPKPLVPFTMQTFAMFTAVLCLMCLADERYTGMQLMLLSAALMLILYNWILVMNMRKGKAKPVVKTKDGFEHL